MAVQVVLFVVAVAMSVISATMQKRKSERARRQMEAALKKAMESSIKISTTSTSEPIRVVYGKHRVAGNKVYKSSLGTGLYMIHCLCDGEIDSIVNDPDGNAYIWFDGERIIPAYSGYYGYQFKTGTGAQVVSSLIHDDIPEFTDPMRHTAYVAWHFSYNRDVYRGEPDINYLIKGKLLYDFRTATTAWSDNPVLALYDYFVNYIGVSASQLDLDGSWTESANYCDTKNFKINMVLNVNDSGNCWDNVESMLGLFRGAITYFDDTFYLKFADLNEEVSVMTISDEHIVQEEDGRSTITISQPGQFDRPTGVRVIYTSSENETYTQDSFVLGNEEGLVIDYRIDGCTDKKMATILGTTYHERMLLDRTISGKFRDDCLLLECMDVVNFSSTSLSIPDQPMRVISVDYSETGLIDLVLQYESLDLYNETFDINTEAIYSTTLPNPKDLPYILNVNVTEENYYYRLRNQTRLKVTFDVPTSSWFDHVEVWVSTNGDVDANYVHQFNANSNFDIDPVEEDQTYWIKLRACNIWNVKQSLDLCEKIQQTIVGYSTTLPPDPNELIIIPINDGINLYSDKLDSADVEHYEFRLGTSWNGALFLASSRTPNYSLKGIKPGTYTFLLNTKGTNGLYGETPSSASVVIQIAKGWTTDQTFTDDYTDSTGATFNRTEHIIYNSNDHLKATHVGGVLVGSYEGPVFDAGIVDTYMAYIDSDITMFGGGNTWDEINSLTWAELGATTKRWYEITDQADSSQVEFTIRYKSNILDGWSEFSKAELIAGVIEARYFQVVITITDSISSSYAFVEEYTLNLLV